MTETLAETTDRPKRNRRRARLRRLLLVLMLFLAICISAGATLFFTAGYWLPRAIEWASPRAAHIQITVGSLDCFPLGRVIAENLAARNLDTSATAVAVSHLRVDYDSLSRLLEGRARATIIKGLVVNDAETVRLAETVRSLLRKPRVVVPLPPLEEILNRWMPELVQLDDARVVTEGRKDYGLRRLRARRFASRGRGLRLGLSLETRPLDSMLPLEINQPLQLDILAGFTSAGIHLVNVRSNLGSLLNMEAAEPARLQEGEAIALQVRDLRFDLDQWVRILDLPLAGALKFDLHIPEWRLGQARQPQAWTGGLGPDAYFSRARLRLQPLQWTEFLPGWTLARGRHDLDLDFAVTPDFKRAWFQTDTALRAERLDTPEGPVDDIAMTAKGNGSLEANRFQWSCAGEVVGPGAGQPEPERARLRIAGESRGEILLKRGDVDAQFAVKPQLERGKLSPFAMPVSGRLRYFPRQAHADSRFEFASEGQVAGGDLALSVSGGGAEQNRSSATLSIRDASLKRLEECARLIGAPLPVHLTGAFSCRASADQATSKPTTAAGVFSLTRLRPRGTDGADYLSRPVDAELAYALSKPVGPDAAWRIGKLELQADRNLRFETAGSVVKTGELLSVRLDPSFEVRSVARALELASATLSVRADGQVRTTGGVDWRQDPKTARIQFRGDAEASDLTVEAANRSWGFSGLSTTAPLTATWRQDMVRGTIAHPVATFELALPQTQVDIDRAFVADRKFRWLQIFLGARGRLLLNPEASPPAPQRLIVVECEQVSAELPDIIKAQGEGRGEWRRAEASATPRVSGEATFSAQIGDVAALADLIHLNIGDAKIQGAAALEAGRLQFGEGWTTCSGRLSAHCPAGQMPDFALAWKNLNAELDLTTRARQDMSSVTLRALGETKLDSLTAGGIVISDISAETSADGGQGRIDLRRCRLLDGTAEATCSLVLRRWPPSVQVSARGRELDLAAFTREFRPGDLRMEGKVDVAIEAGYDPRNGLRFEAKATRVGGVIQIDKATIRTLLVDWAEKSGAGIFLQDEEWTLNRRYGHVDMIPFDEVEATCRYADEHFLNRIVLKNRYFNIVIDSPIDLPVVTEFLKMKQEEMAEPSGS